MMIKLHRGNGKPQQVDINKLCMDYIKKTFLKITPPAVQQVAEPVDRGDNLAGRKKRSRDKMSRTVDI